MILSFALTLPAFAAPWPYDPELKPIDKPELVRVIRNPKTTAAGHRALLSRAATYGLLEDAVEQYQLRLKQQPSNSVLRSAYCYSVFLGHDITMYRPKDRKRWRQQQSALFPSAAVEAEYVVKGAGSQNPFCWRALGFVNLQGTGGGVPKGIEYGEIALKLNPKDPLTHRYLAYAYTRKYAYGLNIPQREQDQALSKAMLHAQKVVQLQPKSESGYRYQSDVFLWKKQYSSAYNSYKKVWTLTPPSLRNTQALKMYQRLAKPS